MEAAPSRTPRAANRYMGTILAIGAALLLTGILAARIYNGRKKPGSPGQRGQIPPRPKPPSRRRSFYERGPGGAGAPPLKNKRSKSERGGLFSGKLKIAAPALAGLVLLLWLGVSLLNSGTGKDEDSASLPAAQAAGPGAQPQKADPLPAPSISVKIAPPPDKVENPVIFDIETAEASPASDGTPTVGPTTPGTPGPADFSPQPATLTEGAKASAGGRPPRGGGPGGAPQQKPQGPPGI
jgi:hypothetical protein